MSRTYRNGRRSKFWRATDSVIKRYDQLKEHRNRDFLFVNSFNSSNEKLIKSATRTNDELWLEAEEYVKKNQRDGCGGLTETPRNTGFKKQAARHVRTQCRRFCHLAVTEDERWWDEPYPNDHLGDQFIWDWW